VENGKTTLTLIAPEVRNSGGIAVLHLFIGPKQTHCVVTLHMCPSLRVATPIYKLSLPEEMDTAVLILDNDPFEWISDATFTFPPVANAPPAPDEAILQQPFGELDLVVFNLAQDVEPAFATEPIELGFLNNENNDDSNEQRLLEWLNDGNDWIGARQIQN